MAAKLPKPPGNFLKSLHNTNKNQQQLLQQNNEDDDLKEDNSNKQSFTAITSSTITTTNSTDNNTTAAIAATKKTNCSCSNISIMHLFHEMKQEFPTIPDTIVAQCVNENCHQRENCIQMLKNELELNPIPAQSYPAKVLHPPNINNNLQNSTNGNNTARPPLQQKPLVVQQKPPLKPIKPIRTAPLQPPNLQQNYNNNSNNHNNNAKINLTSTQTTATTTTTTKPLGGGCDTDLGNKDDVLVKEGNGGNVNLNDKTTKITPHYKQISTTTANSTQSEVCNNDKIAFVGCSESSEIKLPRQRPTTLNLNTQFQEQQQQQRHQRLNIQLQQRFQEQRNRQQQQNATTLTKPMRKAPLPPIAPKPTQFQLNNHTNTNTINNFLNNSLATNHTTTSPLSESEISVSVSLSSPSPSSSSSSPNTTIHHTFNKPTQTKTTHQQHLQAKSPIRHRSVINLQPEPPYTRDFLLTPVSHATSTPSSQAAPPVKKKQTTATNSSSSANSSPTASTTGSQKSFTSVNLTLRPPITPNGANSVLQPSTIDITAGPGFSGASGGGKSLHYSSTSYDARLGYQQNFQITVTDECGVFSASRIRPQYNQQQQQQQQRCLNQQQQQQQHLQLQQHQQFHNNNVVALQQNIQNIIQSPQTIGPTNTSSGFGGSDVCIGGSFTHLTNNMCFSPQQTMDASTQEILQRQKKKRDKLAAALREYKKRLGNVEQEINLLTGTIPTEGLSERLDEEITKLRRDCQDMLRSSNSFTQPPSQQELAINYQPQQMYQQQMYIQQQPQPFPRQGTTRVPPTPRQTSLDIIQHHSQTSTPYTQPTASLPNLNAYNFTQQQQQSQNHTNFSSLTSPPFYHQQQSTAPVNTNFGSSNNNNNQHNSNNLFTDPHNEQDLVKDDDDYEEYEEEIIEPWECNMCTFRNHPQLNICETCENVRIIPEPVISREDIQITLSPGENRIIHSWIIS